MNAGSFIAQGDDMDWSVVVVVVSKHLAASVFKLELHYNVATMEPAIELITITADDQIRSQGCQMMELIAIKVILGFIIMRLLK